MSAPHEKCCLCGRAIGSSHRRRETKYGPAHVVCGPRLGNVMKYVRRPR